MHAVFVLGDLCSEVQHLPVAKDLGYVEHISFNICDKLISICVGNEVWVIEIQVSISMRESMADLGGLMDAEELDPFSPKNLNSISIVN